MVPERELRLTPESAVYLEWETTAELQKVALGYSELLIEAIVLRLVEGVLELKVPVNSGR
jgi:hypothetical protein